MSENDLNSSDYSYMICWIRNDNIHAQFFSSLEEAEKTFHDWTEHFRWNTYILAKCIKMVEASVVETPHLTGKIWKAE